MKKKKIIVSQGDIDELIILCESFKLKESKKPDSAVSLKNPLRHLYSKISAVMEDLIIIRKNDIEKSVETEKSLTNSKIMALELKESSDESLQLSEELSSTNELLYAQKEELEKAKNQLMEMNTNLEFIVLERTKKLENTVNKLNKTVFELDRFIYSASHDLSAPSKSILGLINLTKIDQDQFRLKEYIKYIEISIYKLEDVITNLISYSRNNKSIVVKESFNLYELVVEVINEITILQSDVLIDFKVNIPESQKIVSDRSRLKVILNNIISNGVKYVDPYKSEPTIEVSYINNEPYGKVYVKDNGIGIKKDQTSKIFNMFYRGTVKSTGSGLGLFIVDKTVNILGGKIKVDSIIGVETIFTLYLPIPGSTKAE